MTSKPDSSETSTSPVQPPPSSADQQQQKKKPVAPKRGSQIFTSFPMNDNKSDVIEIDNAEEKDMQGSSSLSANKYNHNDKHARHEEDRENNTPSSTLSTLSELKNSKYYSQSTPAMTNPLDLPGGPYYRPLVGGYAAAAYEAARSLHYSTTATTEASKTTTKEKNHRPSASIP